MSSLRTDVDLVDVVMPQMGVSVSEGTLVSWNVSVGSSVRADSTVCEISTDKIDTEIPAPCDGTLVEQCVGVDSTVEVGAVLGRISPVSGSGDSGSGQAEWRAGPADSGRPGTRLAARTRPSSSSPARSAAGDSAPTGSASSADAAASPSTAAVRRQRGARYSPVVQRIAAEHGVDLARVVGTGREGRVRKQDVLAFLEEAGAAPAAEPALHIESPYRAEPSAAPAAPAAGATLSRIRRAIGEHMRRSLETAATCTTWIEVDMGRVEAARAEAGVTALAFVARTVVVALAEHPALNATLEGDKYTRHSDVNLGIAVSLGEDGLVVPVIQHAQELSVIGLAGRIRDVAERARAGSLSPDEVHGGTFTITNPGQYGSIMATPIINQPQVGILDLEAIVRRPVVRTSEDGTDAIAIRPMTVLGLSWDHRALDGVQAARFLASVRSTLERDDLR